MTPDIEEWRSVVGYEGIYEVSSKGRVRSLDRMVHNGRALHPKAGQLLSAYRGNYSKVRLKRGDGGRTWNVHTLVALAFLGLCPEGMEVCHNNGDPHDNRLSNLRYDTHVANSLDRREHGTAYRRRDADECFHGHPYAEGSFYIDKQCGKRVCLICDAERGARKRQADREAAGRPHRAELTHCKKGHPFDGHNGRQKTCSACQRDYARRYRAKKRKESAP